MNQILYTGGKKKKGQAMEIKSVVTMFAIAIMAFGAILLGKGTFAIIYSGQNNSIENVPVVTLVQDKNTIIIGVKHELAIDKIVYSWNKTQENILQGRGRTEIEERIKIPDGSNLLTVKITDNSGKTVSYTKNCESSNLDETSPEIELLVEGSKVKIIARDETQMDYISYYWNNEDETQVTAREDSPKQIEEKVSIVKGENTLTIIAVDSAGNETTKEQTFKGAKKPTIELFRDGNQLIVKVTDEEGLQKIEYTINGQTYSTDPNGTNEPLNLKEAQFTQPLVSGSNSITIKAYNISGLVEEVSGNTTI